MKTPLYYVDHHGFRNVYDADGRLICDNDFDGNDPQDAARIVACVNACAGVDDPAALRAQLIEYFEADAAAVAELKAIFPEWVNPEAEDRHERTRKLLNLP